MWAEQERMTGGALGGVLRAWFWLRLKAVVAPGSAARQAGPHTPERPSATKKKTGECPASNPMHTLAA